MLEIKNLNVSYGDTQILKNINLKANNGKVLGIVGPNGSGKTTLLKSITHFLEPTGGTILIDGKNINDMKNREIAKNIAVVSQNISVHFDFTVEDIVLMGRTPYIDGSETSKDFEIVREAMEKTHTHSLKDRLATHLSGGELQRVIIARAFAQTPEVLLLDEPTSHLDIAHQIEVLNLVKNASRNGMTVVAVIHDLNLAAYYCDEICMLHNGEILDTGKPENVLTPRNIEYAFKIPVEVNNAQLTNSLYIVPVLEPLS